MGARVKIELGRLEGGIFIVLSDLVVIMYFIHKSYRGVYAGIIGICIAGKYVVNITFSSYIGSYVKCMLDHKVTKKR